jgi:tripeptidyl-peptidase-1
MVQVKMPVSVAESMLQTEFASFRSAVVKEIVILRVTKPYSLPANIAEVVALVDNVLRFPSVDRKQIDVPQAAADSEFSSCGTQCQGFTTPAVLESAYSYSRLSKFTPGNSVAVAEFQYQYYDNTDIEAFSEACDVKVTIAETIGGNKEFICTGIGGCVEALLDIEYIGAVSNPIPLTIIYQADYSLLDWVNSIISMDNPPLVHSVSYGNDEVQQTSAQYMETCNTQFQVAGAMGLTIVFASGDMGVWGRTGVGATFHPDFPAGSPYITAVGGTDFQQKSTIGNETTWSCGGGGFSDEFAQPSWQAAQVQGYFAAANAAGVLPPSSRYNENGRGYPDISALGGQVNAYCVAIRGGQFAGVAGTSASAPVVAGIIALLNDVRLSKGEPPLGFINPWLYSVAGPAGCFNDINDGSKNNCYAGSDGFAALPGWDPATGYGSPNFKCLSALM